MQKVNVSIQSDGACSVTWNEREAPGLLARVLAAVCPVGSAPYPEAGGSPGATVHRVTKRTRVVTREKIEMRGALNRVDQLIMCLGDAGGTAPSRSLPSLFQARGLTPPGSPYLLQVIARARQRNLLKPRSESPRGVVELSETGLERLKAITQQT